MTPAQAKRLKEDLRTGNWDTNEQEDAVQQLLYERNSFWEVLKSAYWRLDAGHDYDVTDVRSTIACVARKFDCTLED